MGLLLPLPQILRPEKSETVGGRDDTFDKEILKKRLVGLEHKLIHATINNPTLYGLPDTVNLLKDTRAHLCNKWDNKLNLLIQTNTRINLLIIVDSKGISIIRQTPTTVDSNEYRLLRES
ncbi:hypothetical protein Tco_0200924 [Tanacetum coccineum]